VLSAPTSIDTVWVSAAANSGTTDRVAHRNPQAERLIDMIITFALL